jgi:hypothetical protein
LQLEALNARILAWNGLLDARSRDPTGPASCYCRQYLEAGDEFSVDSFNTLGWANNKSFGPISDELRAKLIERSRLTDAIHGPVELK